MLAFAERRSMMPADRALKLLVISAMLSSVLGLAACGGGGGYGGGGGGGYGMPVPGVGASKLFAADAGYPGIGSLVNPDPATGMIAVDRFFYGGGLTTSVKSLALDIVNDRLYVGNGTTILVYNGASMASGIPSPARTITGLLDAGSLFIDAANNRLYVGAAPGVKVFAPADMASAAAIPSRFLTGDFGTAYQINGVAVDAGKDILYVSNTTLTPIPSSGHISLFTASTADGTKTPNAIITPMSGMNNLSVAGIALDSTPTTGDRLYVAGPSSTVMVFDQVSILSGAQTPTRTIILPAQIRSVAIDPVDDRLYAVALSGGAIYIVEGASTAMGTLSVVKTIGPVYGNFTGVAVNP
jgi:hypothetical protein